LNAIAANQWLRDKIAIKGHLETTAKLLVYLVVELSGNMYQAENIFLVCLLLCSAELLALGNSLKNFQMNERVVSVTMEPTDLKRQDYFGEEMKGQRVSQY